MRQIINDVIDNKTLKKIVFSKPTDKSVIRTIAVLFDNAGNIIMQFETFTKDGKAYHRNLNLNECVDVIISMTENDYNQTDIITSNGNCTFMRSKKGKTHIVNNIKSGESVEIKQHNKIKNHILDGTEIFLRELAISNENGRIYDKKQAKFKQINRFLELISEISPNGDNLLIYDLCCGKSYLTFAVYHYFTVIKNMNVTMYGIDLKSDVIDKCNKIADKIGFSGLKFISGDITKYEITDTPDMVISLHACDIATDIVLAKAVKSGAKVILSTPCCHHELAGQIDCDELNFITRHGILKQKLCDVITDALRCKRLEIENYKVDTVELIDPDETPKNVMIRAVKNHKPMNIESLKKEYETACKMLNAATYLDKLLIDF